MAKRRRDTDSGADVTPAASGYKTVFVATSLGTHLAIALSFSDTLADFKRKITIQHEQCFPGFGALRIHSVKVKFQRNFYHLHESNILISSAFEGYDGRWSLFVDASSSLEAAKEKPSIDLSDDNYKLDNQRESKAICAIAWKSPGESSLNAGMVNEHVHGTCQENFSLLVNRNLEENSYRSKDDLKGKNDDFLSDDSDEPRAKVGLTAKKQKLVHSVYVVGHSASDISRIGPSHRFNDEAAGNLESFAGNKVSDDVQRSKKDAGGSPYKTSFSGAKVLPESGNLNASQSEPAAEESHVLEKEVVHRDNSDLSIARQLHVLTPAAISESSKKTKKRRKQEHGSNPYVTDDQAVTSKPGTVSEESVLPEACGSETVVVANCGKTDDDESMMALTGFDRNDHKEEEGRLISKHEVCLVASVKPAHHGKTTIANEETVLSLGIADVNKSAEADNSGGNKSKPTKRRAKKSDVPKQDHLDIQHESGAAKKTEVGQTHSRNDVLDLYSGKESYDVVSPTRASVKDQINMEQANEAQCLPMDHADGKVENIETTKKKKKKTAKKTEVGQTHSKIDVLDLYSGKESYDVGSPARANVQDQINMEQAKEAQCLPMDQADEKIENIETTKKKKKNTAKKTAASTGGGLSISEINQQNIGDQELASSVEKLRDVDYAHTLKVRGADEKGIVDQSGVSGLGPKKSVDLKCTGKLELLQQNADCPEVPPYEIKNRSETGRATVVGMANDTIASDGENGSVNFRKYFVPSEDHKEAESTDLPEKDSYLVEAVKEVLEQKVLTKGKRKASKSLGNQKDSDGRNSNDNKHLSSVSKEKQSKKVTEKEILIKSAKWSKVPNHSDAKVNTRKKCVEPGDNGSDSNTTCTPQLQKNDVSLTSPNLNSSLKGSEKVLMNKSNRKKQERLNDSTAAEGKVSRRKGGDPDNSSLEKRLLTTPGVIFGAGRGDSSGDESGIGKSGSTTRTPSDKSSSSGDSTSEGSYDSARKKGDWKSIGSKWFDTRNVPLDEIFRSSSRYKLKLSASQPQAADTDSPPVDFVPDSQPIH